MPKFVLFTVLWIILSAAAQAQPAAETRFKTALENGRLANTGFRRCQRFVAGWLNHADPKTGLIPRNLKRDNFWNARDAAADNYPFMVLTAAITDRPLFAGRMREMLKTEIELTSRVGRLPDSYSFQQQGFLTPEPDLPKIIFGASEYVKDGLLPLTEWLGESPWSARMLGILDDLWQYAPVETPFGKIVSENVEVNGEMLQTLSRVYWMTGKEKYLNWAVRLGDYYLLGTHHPTRDLTVLRLRDHGCEIVSGLCELYATVHFARPEKQQEYTAPLHEMLDRVLEVGRNEHGLFYNSVNPQTGEITRSGVADTWGYTYNGFYTVYLIDSTEAYRTATLKAMKNMHHYHNFKWEGSSADGYADTIESGLNLYNREPLPVLEKWLDSQIQIMWAMQQPDGVIEGWHGDGNFARTTIMYCLWKTAGITARPWRADLIFGAVTTGDSVIITLTAATDWQGHLLFDIPRHQINLNLPLDYPRINQFPEWFTVLPEKKYIMQDNSAAEVFEFSGAELHAGIAVELKAGQKLFWEVSPADLKRK